MNERERETKKRRLNSLDICALILAVLLIIGVAARYTADITVSVRTNITVEYTLKVSAVRDFYVEAIEKGGRLLSSDGTCDMGEITNVTSEGATATVVDESAVATIIDIYDRYDVYITISSEARETETGYVLPDGTTLAYARSVTVMSKYVSFTGSVTELAVVS
ncbi:MAG: DUF4330 domain-containing protein [Firmicutes bacterium]|nr:DUF4330 domain-containing protein [Bacillota bacterium]MCD7783361.1 DUF4330 domain-containing protein [Bacillota bacterium]MCD7787585.1 DUF4330 domain-containing protein [Bacillota bacterium]